MHKRAPMLAQKASATAQPTLPLQPPRPRSLSPHTLVLPYEAALSQPRSVQLETGAGAIVIEVGVEAGNVIGAGVGTAVGAERGAGTGIAVGTEKGK